MLGRLSASARAAALGAGLVGAFAAAAVPAAYMLGRSHKAQEGAARDLAGLERAVDRELVRLDQINDDAAAALAEDRRRDEAIFTDYTNRVEAAAAATAQAARAFNESDLCPARPDDVGVYNAAIRSGSGDFPGDQRDRDGNRSGD